MYDDVYTGERTQVFVTVSQADPRYNPNGTAANGKTPFRKPASKHVDQYPVLNVSGTVLYEEPYYMGNRII
jgi:hypothetical protein